MLRAALIGLRATVVYHEDGYCESFQFDGDDCPAWVRLKEGVAKPSLLLQAGSHDKYWASMLARSELPTKRTGEGDLSWGLPMLVLPDAREARLFDSDQMVAAGGLTSIIVNGCGIPG